MAIIQVSNEVIESGIWPEICNYWDEMIDLPPIDMESKMFGVIGHGAPPGNERITMFITPGFKRLSDGMTWQLI